MQSIHFINLYRWKKNIQGFKHLTKYTPYALINSQQDHHQKYSKGILSEEMAEKLIYFKISGLQK